MAGIAALPKRRLRQVQTSVAHWHLTCDRQKHVAVSDVIRPSVFRSRSLKGFQALNCNVHGGCSISIRLCRLESTSVQYRIAGDNVWLDVWILSRLKRIHHSLIQFVGSLRLELLVTPTPRVDHGIIACCIRLYVELAGSIQRFQSIQNRLGSLRALPAPSYCIDSLDVDG